MSIVVSSIVEGICEQNIIVCLNFGVDDWEAERAINASSSIKELLSSKNSLY